MPAYTTDSPRTGVETSAAAKHRKELLGLNTSFKELEKQCAKKEHRLQEATKEIAKLRSGAEKLASELRAHRNVTSALRAEKEEWETRLDASKSCIRKLESRLKLLEEGKEASRRAKALESEADGLRSSVQELQSQRGETEAAMTQLRAENAVLTKALAIRAEDLGVQAEGLRSGVLYDLGLAKETEQQLRAKVVMLERELKHAQEEVQDLTRGLSKLQAFRREDQDGLADLESRLEVLQKTRQTLLDEVGAFSEERDAMRRMVSHLRAEALAGAEERSALEARELEKSRRVQTLEDRLVAVEREHEGRARKALEKQQELAMQVEELSAAREESDRAQQRLARDTDDASRKIHDMQLTVDKTKHALQEERDGTANLRAELAAMTARAHAESTKTAAAEEAAVRAKSEHEAVLKELRQARQDLARAEGELASEQRARQETSRQLSGLLDDKRRMGRAAEAAVRQCAETLARSPGLEEALRERGSPGRAASSPRLHDVARDSLEETLVRQLTHTSKRLDSLTSSKLSAENSLTRLQRENEQLRALLSKETLAHHRRVRSNSPG